MPRGVKVCSNCKTEQGPRRLVCVKCGQSFNIKSKTVVTKECDTKPHVDSNKIILRYPLGYSPSLYPVYNIIYTPSGECPIDLKFQDLDSVKTWALQIRIEGLKKGQYYTAQSISYYLRKFLDFNTVEYRNLSSVLMKWLDEPVDIYYSEGLDVNG